MPGDAFVLVNWDDWVGEPIQITAGTVVQGPDIQVPDGVPLMLAAPIGNTGNIFYQRTQSLVEDSARRLIISPGTVRFFFVNNARLFWFDAANTGDVVEVIAEKGNAGRTGIISRYVVQ